MPDSGTWRAVLSLVLSLAAVACGIPSDDARESPESDVGEHGTQAGGGAEREMNFQAITGGLLARMDLQPGERVLLVGEAGGRWDPLLGLLVSGIEAAGAVHVGAVDVWGRALPAVARSEDTLRLEGGTGESWVEALLEVDVGVMLPGAVPVSDAPADIYRAFQEVLRQRQGRSRAVHFHWAGATSPDMAELEVDANVDRVYTDALLGTDYPSLARTLVEFEEAMRRAAVRVTTPAGTDLQFQVQSEPVTRQDGDASRERALAARNLIDLEVELPAGAVRILPVLETVEGSIVFPPARWGGVQAEGVTLRFREGRVVGVSAEAGLEGVEAELDAAGDAGRTFRELAVGFNPLLAVPEGESWIPYYGYGAGVVRLSLGDNTELGGTVTGGYVRWNFFTDATVTVGGDAWVRDGRLVQRSGASNSDHE